MISISMYIQYIYIQYNVVYPIINHAQVWGLWPWATLPRSDWDGVKWCKMTIKVQIIGVILMVNFVGVKLKCQLYWCKMTISNFMYLCLGHFNFREQTVAASLMSVQMLVYLRTAQSQNWLIGEMCPDTFMIFPCKENGDMYSRSCCWSQACPWCRTSIG